MSESNTPSFPDGDSSFINSRGKPVLINDVFDAARREMANADPSITRSGPEPTTAPSEIARELGLRIGRNSHADRSYTMAEMAPELFGPRPSQRQMTLADAMPDMFGPGRRDSRAMTLPEVIPGLFGPSPARIDVLGGGLTEPRSSRWPPRFESPPKPFPENPIGTKFCDAWKETFWKDLSFNLLTKRLNWKTRLNVPGGNTWDKEAAARQGSSVGAAILPLLESLGIDLCWPNNEIARHNGEIARGRFPPDLLRDWKEIRKLHQPPLPTADQVVLDELVVSHLETFVAGYAAAGRVSCDSATCPIPPGQCVFVNEFLGYAVLGVFERLDFVPTGNGPAGWTPPNLWVWDFQAVCSVDAKVRVYFTMGCECLGAPKEEGF